MVFCNSCHYFWAQPCWIKTSMVGNDFCVFISLRCSQLFYFTPPYRWSGVPNPPPFFVSELTSLENHLSCAERVGSRCTCRRTCTVNCVVTRMAPVLSSANKSPRAWPTPCAPWWPKTVPMGVCWRKTPAPGPLNRPAFWKRRVACGRW